MVAMCYHVEERYSMKEQSAITVRVDKHIKDEAAKVFNSIGLSFNTGIEVYLRAVVREQRIPFDLKTDKYIPNGDEG